MTGLGPLNISALNTNPLGNVYTKAASGTAFIGSNDVVMSVWTLAAMHPKVGKVEVGHSPTVSAQTSLASFSSFHRIRGGYEDVYRSFTTTGTRPDGAVLPCTPIVGYFGTLGMLLDVPHISYATPSMLGLSLVGELAPAAYIDNVGGVNKNAYALSMLLKEECGNGISYDARLGYASNVLNGYGGLMIANAANQGKGISLIDEQLVAGKQINASLAISYKGWDTSISYGNEFSNLTPTQAITGSHPIDYTTIKPSIIEGTIGYKIPNTLLGGYTEIQATYGVFSNYLQYAHPVFTSSEAKISGIALGQFIGNLAIEARMQHYVTSNNLEESKNSANILSLGVLYLF